MHVQGLSKIGGTAFAIGNISPLTQTKIQNLIKLVKFMAGSRWVVIITAIHGRVQWGQVKGKFSAGVSETTRVRNYDKR